MVRVHHAVHAVEHASHATEPSAHDPAAAAAGPECAHRSHGSAAAEEGIFAERIPGEAALAPVSASAVVHVPRPAAAVHERVAVTEEVVERVPPAEDLFEDLERIVVEPAAWLVPSSAAGGGARG